MKNNALEKVVIKTWKTSVVNAKLVYTGQLRDNTIIDYKQTTKDGYTLRFWVNKYAKKLDKGGIPDRNLDWDTLNTWGESKGLHEKHIRNTYRKIRRAGVNARPFLQRNFTSTFNSIHKGLFNHDFQRLIDKYLRNEY